MRNLYEILSTVCIILSLNYIFDLKKDIKIKVLLLILITSFISAFSIYLSVPIIYIRIITIFIISFLFKNKYLKIISTELILEAFMMSLYYLLILLIPLIIEINIKDLLYSESLICQLLSILAYSGLFYYYSKNNNLNITLNETTYLMACLTPITGILGLQMIHHYIQYFTDLDIYVYIFSFTFILILSVMITVYFIEQYQKDINTKIELERLSALEYQSQLLNAKSKMIENIKHDLLYFNHLVKGQPKEVINKINEELNDYNQYELFNDHVLNSFIFKLRHELLKDITIKIIAAKDLYLTTDAYNDLLSIIYSIKECIKDNLTISIQYDEDYIMYEFIFISKNDIHNINNSNAYIEQNGGYTSLFYLMERS